MPKIENVRIARPEFVEQSTPTTQSLYGCDHYTSHLKYTWEAPQGIEIAPANEFHEFRSTNPSPASVFMKK